MLSDSQEVCIGWRPRYWRSVQGQQHFLEIVHDLNPRAAADVGECRRALSEALRSSDFLTPAEVDANVEARAVRLASFALQEERLTRRFEGFVRSPAADRGPLRPRDGREDAREQRFAPPSAPNAKHRDDYVRLLQSEARRGASVRSPRESQRLE